MLLESKFDRRFYDGFFFSDIDQRVRIRTLIHRIPGWGLVRKGESILISQ